MQNKEKLRYKIIMKIGCDDVLAVDGKVVLVHKRKAYTEVYVQFH